MSEQEGLTERKAGDFSEWYNQVVLKSGLADFSSVKGFMFIRPYGYEIWERIQETFNRMLKETGHRNAYSPALIPESLLKKEKEHVEGFSPELFYVTQSGGNKLEERLVLRPTSETIIYDAYSKWIRSWRDLPVLYNYWNSVFRAEIKMTKLFLRTCEFLWQEGHTVHETEAGADQEVMSILGMYRQLFEDYLAIPVLEGRKTESEKFAGALYTTALEGLMPDGKALQMATSHNLGQNFSKAFNICFLDRSQKKQHAWQTSWGFSTRLIGAIVMVHGDDKGLVLPPKIAPIQVVIIPIYNDQNKDAVLKEAEKLEKALGGTSVHLDSRDGYSPGWKFHEWELKGVPLRIEIGSRDIENKQVVLARRDTGKKEAVKMSSVKKEAEKTLDEIQKSLFLKAKKSLDSSIKDAGTFPELKKSIEGKLMAKTGWCGSDKCEEKAKQETGADIRLVPFKKEKAGCIVCRKAGQAVFFSRAY